MDSPGSDSPTDSPDTSSSDSSSDGPPSEQIITDLNETQPVASIATNMTVFDNNDDSASDVSMSADTDTDDDDDIPLSSIQVNPSMNILERPAASKQETLIGDSGKRKHPETADEITNGHTSNGTANDNHKRIKLDNANETSLALDGHLSPDRSLLPAEIWHHIFTFVPPKSLGLLLRVNRTFNSYLDPSSRTSSVDRLPRSTVQILNSNAIWRASRRLFWSGMPGPLREKSELDMWKLACATSCQFCRKKPSILDIISDQWHPGPGENGTVPIWSFGVHTCGPCIQERSSKEIDLFLSTSVPSQLMSALPFIFITNELQILPLATVQSGRTPQSISIAKVFFNAQLEAIKNEFTSVKDLGLAAVEEWLKGLDDKGKEARNDAARWEKWDNTGGVATMRAVESQETWKTTTRSDSSTYTTGKQQPQQPIPATNGNSQVSTPSSIPLSIFPQIPPNSQGNFSHNIPARYDSPSQSGFASYPPRAYQQGRHERSKEEVAELKAARRAEIERRCLLLDPPLTAGVLAHMGSFQAAIQIIQPLDDGAWEVLKPRLLSQREDAEQREKERIAQTRVVLEQINNQDSQVKTESKDPYDRDWDIQEPLRARIGGYADETIRDGWAGGSKVSKDNCPTFAAEVLLYVRKRFYAEVAKDEAALRAAGREPVVEPPEGPSSRKLTLENMKWVFESKIKPHTEEYRKELFLCNDCEISKNYGFEGVIQHYAAKHTNTLSMGSIVVHWKSEWPEHPPFNPEPTTGKTSAYYATAPSASVPYPPAVPQQSYGYGGYQPNTVSAPLQNPQSHVYQENPEPYYGHQQFGDQYSNLQNGPYAPPQPYQDQSQNYQQYSGPPVSNTGYNDPAQNYVQQGYENQYPQATQGYYNPPTQTPLYQSSAPDVAIQQPAYAPPDEQYGYNYNQPPSAQIPPALPVPAQHPQFTPALPKTEEYKSQLLDVAKNSRDIWDTIHNLKEVPGSVKVYTIIYHVLTRSRFRFHDDPPLSMIVDGLTSNKDMRKVRNINGLLCRACKLGMPGSLPASQIRHMSFPQLVSHFHTAHVGYAHQNGYDHIPDWTKDMVQLPEPAKLTAVANAAGMTDQKLKLIAEAIPEIFAAPQTNPEPITNIAPSNGYEQPISHDPYDPPPSKDNHEKYYTTIDNSKVPEVSNGTYDNAQCDPQAPHDLREQNVPRATQSRRKALQHAEEYYPPANQERHERSYAEPSPQVRSGDGYSRVIIREEPPRAYADTQLRYREEGDVNYRSRHAIPALPYEELGPVREHNFGHGNSQAYAPSHREATISAGEGSSRYREGTVTQQNRIYDVVAQISEEAKQARAKPLTEDPIEGGSEDGELRGPSRTGVAGNRAQQPSEATNAAERFLENFMAGGESHGTFKRVAELQSRSSRHESDFAEGRRSTYQPLPETHRYVRDEYIDDGPMISTRGRPINPEPEDPIPNGYIVHGRTPPPRQSRIDGYDDRYISVAPVHAAPRERSPELVDRRFKLNTVVYRDERPASHGMHRTPSNRYARYESVRLENDRARSRSPVYVKIGSHPAQYRDRSPVGAHPSPPTYRAPQNGPPEDLAYEQRAPHQNYYRVYADEPPRQPQYIETFEYVRVSDPQGDYMIRRPVRREAEAVAYAPYDREVDPYPQRYESRGPAPVPAAAPRESANAPYYEEYDPRHPAPPVSAAAAAGMRGVRYQ